ncbi:MAG: hypothetical protein LBP80_07660 [Treponema sp.]|nr:hypothetical protein [Treponema sp.]
MDQYLTSTLVELTYTEVAIVCEKIMRIGLDWDLNFQASIVIFQDGDDLYIQFFGLTDPAFTKYIKRLKYKKVLADYYYTNVSDDEFDNPDSIIFIILGLAAFGMGVYMAWTWFKNDILVLEARQKAGKWETPKEFKERTGSSLPGEAAVYCRWKKDGPMYKKLGELHANNIAADPDIWVIHTHFAAMSLGDAHGEQMEILCADSDMGCPPIAVWNGSEEEYKRAVTLITGCGK